MKANYAFVAVMAVAALVEYLWYRRARRQRRLELFERRMNFGIRSISLTPKDILDLEIRDAARRG